MSNALELEVVTLRAALAASQAETAEVRTQLKKLQADFDALLEIATKQSEQLAELRTMLRRKTTPQKPPAAVPSDPEGDTASATTEPSAAVADPDPAPVPKPWPKKVKTRPKGAGWLPKPDHVPEVVYRGNVCKCEHCGSSNLLKRDHYTASRIDAVETIARLRREILEVATCKDCGKTTTAPPPSLPCERAKFTCGFLAWLVVMKFVLLVPLNRIHKLLRRQGVHVPKSTLVRLIALATDLASPIDKVHWRELKERKCILTDGTGLKVQIDGLPKVWHAVLDVFNGDQTAVYKFALTKHGDEIAKLLTGFQGVIMCDAESRLNELCRQEGIKRANCNAHPRREFRDAEAAQPILAKKAGDFISKMYGVERRATAEGLIGPDLLARRQAETRPIVDAFKLWLDAQLVTRPPLLKSDPFGKVVRYYLAHFDDLTRFVDDADIPIDNNPSERAFQDHARLRLNSLFAGSPKGGHRWAVLLGLVTTAKRHELDIQAYLTWMFERRGTRRRDYKLDPVDLTPAAYKRMLERQHADAVASREARDTDAA
jgi:transposase